MNEKAGGGGGGHSDRQGDRPIYLRQWTGRNVSVVTAIQTKHSGVLTNIVFDEKRLMYIVLDDRTVLNFDHIIEVRLDR
jgi:RNase P/RNase MRP subunit p29